MSVRSKGLNFSKFQNISLAEVVNVITVERMIIFYSVSFESKDKSMPAAFKHVHEPILLRPK